MDKSTQSLFCSLAIKNKLAGGILMGYNFGYLGLFIRLFQSVLLAVFSIFFIIFQNR
jgi:hypothetical protein